MSKITLKIVGERTMHCGGCENGVRFSLSQLPGVEQVNPDRITQLVEVSLSSEETGIEQLKAQLEYLGYQAETV